MSPIGTFKDEDLPTRDEADIAKALEAAVRARNSFPQDVESQLAVVRDGLIVAVERLTTGELIWTN